jgi:hypothetical protein
MWNNTDREKPKDGEKPVPLPLYPQETPHGMVWDPTCLSTVR